MSTFGHNSASLLCLIKQQINLDGGGSATGVVTGGVVINQPSDVCGLYGTITQHCEREVTSVACFR